MSGLDLSHLSPHDAIAALRSYPRRFRELFESVEPDELTDEAIAQADHVARSVALLGEALRQVLIQDDPVLLPAVTDDNTRDWVHPGATATNDVLDFVSMESNALADAIADVDSAAWTRTGTVAGSGQKVSALDIVREAVRTGAAHLRVAEQLVGRGT